jgi:hypothetical protein
VAQSHRAGWAICLSELVARKCWSGPATAMLDDDRLAGPNFGLDVVVPRRSSSKNRRFPTRSCAPPSSPSFTDRITASMTVGDEVRVPDALIQPIAADELAAEIARVAEGEPLGGIENIGGPEKISFEQMAREVLARQGEAKTVVVDPQVGYFGTPPPTNILVTA